VRKLEILRQGESGGEIVEVVGTAKGGRKGMREKRG